MPAATQTSRSERPAEYRIQNTEYRIRAAHTPPTAQFPESRIQHPLMCHLCSHAYASHAHVAGRIQNAEYRMRAGPSNMQFPRLLGDSVCCGRIQNAGRRMQGYWKTPTSAESKVFENTESRPAVSISPPATSPHLPRPPAPARDAVRERVLSGSRDSCNTKIEENMMVLSQMRVLSGCFAPGGGTSDSSAIAHLPASPP